MAERGRWAFGVWGNLGYSNPVTEGDIMKSAILSVACALLALTACPASVSAAESAARPDIAGLTQKAGAGDVRAMTDLGKAYYNGAIGRAE